MQFLHQNSAYHEANAIKKHGRSKVVHPCAFLQQQHELGPSGGGMLSPRPRRLRGNTNRARKGIGGLVSKWLRLI